jgi:hypothetical protein
MKYCNSCETEKESDKFGKRAASKDGLCAKCKTCQKVYDKARAGDEGREEARRIYAQTEQGKEASNRAKAEYRKRNPVKSKATAIVGRAVRSGKLFSEPCSECGCNENIHAHHDDYSKPLNVRWLCAACHRQWHKANGEGKNAS